MSNRKQRRKRVNKAVKKDDKLAKIYWITFVVAFCSIVYQLLLAHTIALIAGSAIIWYSITVGVFLGSLGIGSILSGKINKKNSIQKLFLVEILLAFFGAISVCFMHFVQIIDIYFWAHGNIKLAFVFILFGSQSIVFSIGFLSGFELPMLMNMANTYSKEKRVTNRVLGIDYFGSLLGAVLFPLALVPFFRGITIGFVVAFINVLAAFFLISIFIPRDKKNKKRFTACFIFLIPLSVVIFKSEGIEKHFSKKYYYYPQAVYDFKNIFSSFKDAPNIETYHSAYQKIDIVNQQTFNLADVLMDAYTDKLIFDENFPIGKELYLNGDWQFNSGTEEIYHEYFAHVPILATDEIPKKVLVLGAGDGMLTRELLKYREIEKIVQVEIDPEMARLSREHKLFLAMNKGSLLDKRVELKITDAYSFVRNSKEKFDAIYLDFPTPVDYNTSRLYSREFYVFVRKCLNDKGFIVLDAPGVTSGIKLQQGSLLLNENEKSPWKEYAYTVKAAGFESVIPFISNLEKDNEHARKLANEYILSQYTQGISSEEKEEAIDDIVSNFVLDSQESFIFAQKELASEIAFHKADISTYLLNQKRFERAFQLDYKPIEKVEWQYVNSVLKPTIPKRNFWQIRFPYYIQ